jgi:glycosyl transferase family 25
MRIFVINLARSDDRRASMTAQLTEHGIEFELVKAVDGRELDMTDPKVLQSILPEFRAIEGWQPAMAGCAMSHLEVYRKVIDEDLDVALVLEDDILIPDDLEDVAAQVAKELRGAEVGLLNFESPRPIRFRRHGGVALSGGARLIAPVEVGQPVSSAAYVVTREACERISEGQRPISVTADGWAHFYDEGMLDMVHCVVPMPVAKDPQFASTLEYNRQTSLKARMLSVITRHGPGWLLHLITRRRQRIWRKHNRIEFVDDPMDARTS